MKIGKINIMEHSGSKENNIYYNIHCEAYGSSRGGLTSLSDSNIFHTYRVDWNSERIIFYIGDKIKNKIKNNQLIN